VPFGRVGCLGASQSFGLRRQASWLKVWRGGGCNFSATERAHKRNGGQIDAECRRPSLVTTSGVQRNCACGIEKTCRSHRAKFTSRLIRHRRINGHSSRDARFTINSRQHVAFLRRGVAERRGLHELGRVGRGAQTGDRHSINGASSHRDGTPQSRRLRRQFIRRIRSERGTTAVVHPNAQNQKNSGVPAGMTTWWVSVVVPGAPARNRTWLAGPLQMPGSTSHSRWFVDCPRSHCHHLVAHSW
jgi:hypothetical protein